MRRMTEAQLAGTIVREDAEKVEARAREFETKEGMESDDPHVLGLALVSGARLLYTNDLKLQQDFKNPALIRPRGQGVHNSGQSPLYGRARRFAQAAESLWSSGVLRLRGLQVPVPLTCARAVAGKSETRGRCTCLRGVSDPETGRFTPPRGCLRRGCVRRVHGVCLGRAGQAGGGRDAEA